jgi:hypothetical protein
MSLSFTNSGYLLAWIIEGLQEKKRKASNIQICNVLEYNYKDRPSSFDFFALLLTEKFKEQGLFDELVANALRDRVADPRWNINTMLELVYSLSIPDKRNGKLFYEIWIQTLNELDVSQKKIVMQYVKLNIGRLIEMDLKYPKGYEELRYRLRDKPNLLAVEGVCNNRRSTHLCPLTMNLIDYIKIDKSPYTPSGMTCPRCGSSNTLSITLPYY